MFVYLSKKLAIPDETKIYCIVWNHGWIACGGENGLLEVAKIGTDADAIIKPPRETDAGRGGSSVASAEAAPSSTIPANQVLEGHASDVTCLAWNAKFQKLASADHCGRTIVWDLRRGNFCGEMMKKYKKAATADMKWSSDGTQICIGYTDGTVSVLSMDGTELWGRELGVGLRSIEWSPCGRNISFAEDTGAVVHYYNGHEMEDVLLNETVDDSEDNSENLRGDTDSRTHRGSSVVGLYWYNGEERESGVKKLAVAFSNGQVQLRNSMEDTNPTKLDTGIDISICSWNPEGTLLAVAGAQCVGENRFRNKVKFYGMHGELKELELPSSTNISDVSWESISGNRIAIALGSAVYFASVRKDYIWAFAGSTLVYAHATVSRWSETTKGVNENSSLGVFQCQLILTAIFIQSDSLFWSATQKAEAHNQRVTFWNTSNNQTVTRSFVGHVRHIIAAADYCAIIIQRNEGAEALPQKENINSDLEKHQATEYTLLLCDAVGSHVESRYVPIAPLFATMTSCCIISSDKKRICLWQYGTALKSPSHTSDGGIAWTFDSRSDCTDRSVTGYDAKDGIPISSHSSLGDYRTTETADSLMCAMASSDELLFVALENEVILCYSIPGMVNLCMHKITCEPSKLFVNCNATKICALDSAGKTYILDRGTPCELGTTSEEKYTGEVLPFERNKDVWEFRWSEDDPERFALLTGKHCNLHVFESWAKEPEVLEPTTSSGSLIQYKDLEVKIAMFDAIMTSPRVPEGAIFHVETKDLRDERQRITSRGISEALKAIDRKSRHPRLLRLLAEEALELLDFSAAERAYVELKNYHGICTIKNLASLDDPNRQSAEVAAFLKRYDDAETSFRDIDRHDLAIELRSDLGDWSRVSQLVRQVGGNDKILSEALDRSGAFYAERSEWSQAAKCYFESGNMEEASQCLYLAGNFEGLKQVFETLNDASPILLSLGNKFETSGLFEEAIDCFLKAGERKRAIDTCVIFNEWELAFRFAAESDASVQVESLLAKYVGKLLAKGEQFQAVAMYRKAGKSEEAARLLSEMADSVGHDNPLQAKKLYVLAALEVERYRSKDFSTMTGKGQTTQSTLATLDTFMSMDAESRAGGGSSRVLVNAWRGAAAFHYFLLAHRQWYQGDIDAAMKTAIRCASFEDVIDTRAMYSLVALASFGSENSETCSRALMKLETLPETDDKAVDYIQRLAMDLFDKQNPSDGEELPQCYRECLENGVDFNACILSGRPIQHESAIKCKQCRYFMIEDDIIKNEQENCALCHAHISEHAFSTAIMEQGSDAEF